MTENQPKELDSLVLTEMERQAIRAETSAKSQLFSVLRSIGDYKENDSTELGEVKRAYNTYLKARMDQEAISGRTKKALRWEKSQKAQEANAAYNKETNRLTHLERALSHQCRR